MTATAAGAESVATGQPPLHAHPSATGSRIELTSDFPASADLELPGDVLLLPPVPAGGPAFLRLEMPPDAARQLVDHLLRLGYHLRRARLAPGSRPAPLQEFYVRGGPAGPLRLRCTGGVSVARGADGLFTLAPAGAVRIGRDATWGGDIDAGDDVWVEAGACVRGSVRTPGTLVLDEGSHVEGDLQVGRVRFRSRGARDPTGRPLPAEARPEPVGISIGVAPHPARSPRPAPPARPRQEPSQQVVEEWSETSEEETSATSTPALAEPTWETRREDPGVMLPAASTAAGPSDTLVLRGDPFRGLPPLPGRFRVVAHVAPDAARDEMPRPLRAHREPGLLLEVEVLAATRRGVALAIHPGTPAQRRVECSAAEARRDPLLAHLAPVLPRVTTLRLVYGDGVRGVRASAHSLRWLVTLFGKMLRLESRLDRLEEMRILTGGEGARTPLPPKRRTRRRRRAGRAGPRTPAKARSRSSRRSQQSRRSPPKARAPKAGKSGASKAARSGTLASTTSRTRSRTRTRRVVSSGPGRR